MAGPVEGRGPKGTNDRGETPPPLTKEQIEGHVSTLKSLIKSHNQRNKGDPIHLDFKLKDTKVQDHGIAKGKEVMDEDLEKPFNEAGRTPLTHRIIKFAGPEYKMPTNIKLYDGTTDPEDHLSCFASAANSRYINEWADLREAFATRYSIRRACFKEPHEITKILKKANESLKTFKERWTLETGFIMGVPEVMKISSFMDSVKSPELAKRFSNKVPTTMNEMMERLDDFIYVNSVKDKKQKVREMTELWINIPISFRTISSEDIYEEPLIVKAGVKGYLVRRVYVDEGSSVEVMFEHCFENLGPRIKARLKETQTDLVRFAGEISKPLGKIELETVIIAECRRLEKKQMIKEKSFEWEKEMVVMEEVLVNPSFPYQQVTIRGGLSEACRDQLKYLLKDNIGVFTWEPSDMTGVPRQIIENKLSVNPSMDSVCHKRRTFSMEKSGVVTNEVAELVKVGIVCPVSVRATYQRLVDSTFQHQIGRNLEAYVDDMVIKSKDEKILMADIAKTFDNLKIINMKLNLKKCSFGVEEGKFLAHMVIQEGIEANPKKTKALIDLSSSRTLKEMQSLSGKLVALNRFLAKRSFPANEEAHYGSLVAHSTLREGNLVRILGGICRSRAYSITSIPRNAVKGQVLADFLSKALEGEKDELYFRMLKIPLEKDDTENWTLFTDGASSLKGSGESLVLIGPNGVEYTYAFLFTFLSTNNEAEYEALLTGLRIARQMNISNIKVKVDSKLEASLIKKNCEACKDSMIKYLVKVKEYASGFKSFLIKNIPRNMNQKAGVLSKLASVAFNHLTKEVLVEVLNERSTKSQEVRIVVEEEVDNWMTPIIRCLEEGIWLKEKNEA
nr:hypothetical protein [Tanacetum cinerariifolium]